MNNKAAGGITLDRRTCVGCLFFGGLLLGTHLGGVAQTCLPPDDSSASILPYAIELATSEDPDIVETRDLYGILPVAASEVELITSNNTCRKAGREYKKTLGLAGPAPDVHLVRIGTRYIAWNPDSRAGEFILHVVFDEQFNELHVFAG